MSGKSSIEWTEATWNPVRGCTKVSAGCKNCYAETFAERWRGIPGHAYEQGFDLRLVPEALDVPLRWKKPRRIFVNSMSDLFHEDVPDDFIDHVFASMVAAPQHTYQVLTKRADRMRAYVAADHRAAYVEGRAKRLLSDKGMESQTGKFLRWPLPNVWLGVSVEDQAAADQRIPILLDTPAAVRFLSCEPLLGPMRVDDIGDGRGGTLKPLVGLHWVRGHAAHGSPGMRVQGGKGPRIDWVIVGGESGPGARPMDLGWPRRIVADCRSAAVPCFVKQLGAHPHERMEILRGEGHDGKDLLDIMKRPLHPACRDGWTSVVTPTEEFLERYHRMGDRKGGDPSEWQEDLRVREMPQGAR